jgi:hypothetical protein
MRLHAQGTSLREMRRAIEARYEQRSQERTPTPEVAE